jgi:hypothetical protein
VSNAVFTVNDFTSPQTLAAGQSVQFSVTFSPAAAGGVSGTVGFSSDAGSIKLPASGKGVTNWALTATPSSLSFGHVTLGHSSTLPLTVSNPGTTTDDITIGEVGGAGFSVRGVKLPLILAPGQSFTFSVRFSPQSTGDASGSIVATSPTSPSLTVPLSGTADAAGLLSASPATMSFGNVNVGENASQSGMLSASGASVTVSSASINQTQFSLSGIKFPVTIAAGQSVMYAITFAPQTPGAISANLLFASDASNSPTLVSLIGTGISKQYTVSLSWDPSTSDVVGYNVYRGTQPGGPYTQLNSTLDPNTAYADTSVVDGQTYYYATTAVNSGGQESSYSNLSQAVIP